MSPIPKTVQLLLTAGAVGAMLLIAWSGWSYEIQVAAFVGLALVLVFIGLSYQRRLPGNGPEAVGPDAEMPGARGLIADFERAGYRRLGGYRWALRGRLVIAAVLAPAERDRYVIVTDRVFEIASRFGGLSFTTTNSGRAPAPADVLRQVVPGGSPSEIQQAHEAGLERLAGEGLRPERFVDDVDILRYVREVEEAALRNTRVPSFMAQMSQELRGDTDPELGDDDESRLRIDAWRRGAS